MRYPCKPCFETDRGHSLTGVIRVARFNASKREGVLECMRGLYSSFLSRQSRHQLVDRDVSPNAGLTFQSGYRISRALSISLPWTSPLPGETSMKLEA